MHVIRLALRSTGDDLGNDTEVKFPVLQGGILISFDRAVAPESMSQPTCFLTLELPFPLSPPDLQAWPNVGPVGFEPMIVTAEVRRFGVRKGDMLWFPAGTLTGLLQQVFGHLAEQKRELRVLARLTLKGGFIWSLDDPPVFLDGDTFGAPGNGTTDLLPFRDGSLSGDGRRGGDFEMWFWLVP